MLMTLHLRRQYDFDFWINTVRFSFSFFFFKYNVLRRYTTIKTYSVYVSLASDESGILMVVSERLAAIPRHLGANTNRLEKNICGMCYIEPGDMAKYHLKEK